MSIIPTTDEIIEMMVEANKELNNHKIAVATFALKRRREEDLKALEALKAELKQKDEKLSEFQEGIPIEKAKECGDYYCLDLGYCVATYFENGKWYYSDDGPNRNPCEVSNRLYPLPSTETQMEGS